MNQPQPGGMPEMGGEGLPFPAGPATQEQLSSPCWAKHIAPLLPLLGEMGTPPGTVRVGELADFGSEYPALAGGIGGGHSAYENTPEGRAFAQRQLYELLDPAVTEPGTARSDSRQ